MALFWKILQYIVNIIIIIINTAFLYLAVSHSTLIHATGVCLVVQNYPLFAFYFYLFQTPHSLFL